MPDKFSKLISRISSGDRNALHELHHEASPIMFGILCKYFREKSDAEDALHDVLVKVWRTAPKFDSSRKGLPWLLTVTRNHAIDVIRRRREDQLLDDQLDGVADLTSVESGSHEMRMAIGQCLSKLQPKHAKMILEIYVWGYTYEEVAQKMGRPVGTIKVWISRSILILRECMQSRDD
ncbi:hypothetical protein AL073_18115 [Loktanella sp. 1ANDIMAR09]|nr:hypothetical protein AL073_18115 [Loktanella sp. 1ANDIMAR09]